MVAGDTVYVKAGTYNENVKPERSGSEGNWITYSVYPGDKVSIDGNGINVGSDFYGLVGIYNKSYIEFNGFEVFRSNQHGVAIHYECHYINLKNLTIHETQLSGIFASYNYGPTKNMVTDILIDNCELYNTNFTPNQESLTLIAVNRFEIKNCKVHDVQGNYSASFPRQNGIDVKVGCDNGSIHDNEIYNSFDGIYIDTGDAASQNISIYNNRVHNNLGAGITLGSERTPYSSITNVNVYNNLVYLNTVGFLSDYYPTDHPFISNFRLINNTFYKNDKNNGIPYYEIRLAAPYSYSGQINYVDCVIRNNIIVGKYAGSGLIIYDGYDSGGVIIDHNLFYDALGYYSSNKYGTNYIQENPALVNPDGGNFQLQSNSPALNAGSATGVPATDYSNSARPQGTGYDIGAYEYVETTLNHAPVISSIGNKIINEGLTLTFTVSASDPDGNGLIYSASNLPSGASFNNSTHVFSWTPNFAQAGTHPGVRFSASDGSLSTYEDITITINQPFAAWDTNQDGATNVLDLVLVSQHWGESGTPGWIKEDVNTDGIINVLDNIIIGQQLIP
jgi:hypothetical protein